MGVQQIAILGRMRGGTTVFRQFVGSAPHCFDLGEVFHGELSFPNNFWRFLRDLVDQNPSFMVPSTWPDAWSRFLEMKGAENRAVSLVFDAKMEYFPSILSGSTNGSPRFFFDSPSVKYVSVLRKNLLAQVISFRRASRSNVWSIINEAASKPTLEKLLRDAPKVEAQMAEALMVEAPMAEAIEVLPLPAPMGTSEELTSNVGPPVFMVDPEDLYVEVARLVDETARFVRQMSGIIDLFLWYEDMFDADGMFSEMTAYRVGKVCGISPELFDRKPVLLKQSEGVLAGIDNAADLVRRFRGTEYAWMLEARA